MADLCVTVCVSEKQWGKMKMVEWVLRLKCQTVKARLLF